MTEPNKSCEKIFHNYEFIGWYKNKKRYICKKCNNTKNE